MKKEFRHVLFGYLLLLVLAFSMEGCSSPTEPCEVSEAEVVNMTLFGESITNDLEILLRLGADCRLERLETDIVYGYGVVRETYTCAACSSVWNEWEERHRNQET